MGRADVEPAQRPSRSGARPEVEPMRSVPRGQARVGACLEAEPTRCSLRATKADVFEQLVRGDRSPRVHAGVAVLVKAVPRTEVRVRAEREREACSHGLADAHDLDERGRGGPATLDPRDGRLRDARPAGQLDLTDAGVEPTPPELHAEPAQQTPVVFAFRALVRHRSIVPSHFRTRHHRRCLDVSRAFRSFFVGSFRTYSPELWLTRSAEPVDSDRHTRRHRSLRRQVVGGPPRRLRPSPGDRLAMPMLASDMP